MQTVLITGANRGLGLVFTRRYAEAGWRVIACCRSASAELTDLAARFDDVAIEKLDVADLAAIDALAQRLDGEAIDLLLNNAGIYGKLSFADGGVADQAFGATDYKDWEKVLQVNLFGPMKMAEAFVEHVSRSKEKKIVTLSSIVGSMGMNVSGGMYAYRTSKAAVNMMMHSMGQDLAERGILAVAVHPGWVRTDMGGEDADIEAEESVAGVMEVIAGLTPEHPGRLIAYDGSVLPY